jgi:hypothetical protein
MQFPEAVLPTGSISFTRSARKEECTAGLGSEVASRVYETEAEWIAWRPTQDGVRRAVPGRMKGSLFGRKADYQGAAKDDEGDNSTLIKV